MMKRTRVRVYWAIGAVAIVGAGLTFALLTLPSTPRISSTPTSPSTSTAAVRVGPAGAVEPDAVVATVGNKPLTAALLEAHFRVRATAIKTPADKRRVFDRFVAEEQLAQGALDAGIVDQKELKGHLAVARDRALIDTYQAHFRRAAVTEVEVSAEYARTRDSYRKRTKVSVLRYGFRGDDAAQNAEAAQGVAKLLRAGERVDRRETKDFDTSFASVTIFPGEAPRPDEKAGYSDEYWAMVATSPAGTVLGPTKHPRGAHYIVDVLNDVRSDPGVPEQFVLGQIRTRIGGGKWAKEQARLRSLVPWSSEDGTVTGVPVDEGAAAAFSPRAPATGPRGQVERYVPQRALAVAIEKTNPPDAAEVAARFAVGRSSLILMSLEKKSLRPVRPTPGQIKEYIRAHRADRLVRTLVLRIQASEGGTLTSEKAEALSVEAVRSIRRGETLIHVSKTLEAAGVRANINDTMTLDEQNLMPGGATKETWSESEGLTVRFAELGPTLGDASAGVAVPAVDRLLRSRREAEVIEPLRDSVPIRFNEDALKSLGLSDPAASGSP